MEIKRRLALLESDRGSGLAERLRYLTGGTPRQGVAPLRRMDEEEIARRLGGRRLEEGLIGIERTIPLTYAQGAESLEGIYEAPLSVLDPSGLLDPAEMLFLDTETTGLAGGTGTLAFVVGLGWIGDAQLRLAQLFLTGFKGEHALLERLAQVTEGSASLVSFNGKGFDVPLLSARYRLAKATDPLASLRHVDLLYLTRRAFATRWPDCRLQTVEQRLLGFSRDGDLPGYLVPEVWSHFVRHGVFQRVPDILEHNRQDLISLVALLSALLRVYAEPGPAQADAFAIARAHLRRGAAEHAYRCLLLQQGELDDQGLLLLARLHWRRGQEERALEIWERLASRGQVQAMEQLAKYHEHIGGDLLAALRLTAQLLELQARVPEHARRQARLLRKMLGLGIPRTDMNHSGP